MKGYAQLEVFTPRSIRLLEVATMAVERLPDTGCYEGTEEWIRCHELARIVAIVLAPEFSLEIIDGRYGPTDAAGYEHSWLLYEEPTQKKRFIGQLFILDPYAIGRLPQVQLLDPYAGNLKLYMRGKPRDDIRHDHVKRESDRIKELWGGRLPA